MTEPPAYDVGHLLPPDEWARVVSEAEAIVRGEHARLGRAGLLPRLTSSAFPSITGFVQAKYDGGARPGPPTFGVWHDAETPLAPGYALAIANYFTRCTNQTSAHFMLGPEAGYQLLDTARIAWHCGNGNPRSIGVENCGYVSFTAAQWLTPDAGMPQMQRGATLLREIEAAHGIGPYWMTDQQLRNADAGRIVGGWATHDQCRRVLGGTSHTDPMPTYPLQQLMALANDGPTEDDLTPEQWNFIQQGINVTNGALGKLLNADDDPNIGILKQVNAAAVAAQQALDAIKALPAQTVDLAALKQAVTDGVKAAGVGADTTAIVAGVFAGFNGAQLHVTPAS